MCFHFPFRAVLWHFSPVSRCVRVLQDHVSWPLVKKTIRLERSHSWVAQARLLSGPYSGNMSSVLSRRMLANTLIEACSPSKKCGISTSGGGAERGRKRPCRESRE
jgi:hypothetical protein